MALPSRALAQVERVKAAFDKADKDGSLERMTQNLKP